MNFLPLLQGLASTTVAVLMAASWIAIGMWFAKKISVEDEAYVPIALLIGSAIVSFALAVVCFLGFAVWGTVLIEVGAAIVLLARWRRVLIALETPGHALLDRARGMLASVGIGVVIITMWLTAIAPPRAADAMRYHLAHIRQIASEGRWAPISDFHYALPFAWSLNYLPFELLDLPQGSQLLGVVLFALFFALVMKVADRLELGTIGVLTIAAFCFHPAVTKAFTDPGADGYSILVVMTVSTLVLRLGRLGGTNAVILGFVSWVGIGSRYQLIAIGLASAISLVLVLRYQPARIGLLTGYAVGAVNAFALASPFYVMNALAFRNPMWPLMISEQSAAQTYANFVAHDYAMSMRGSYSIESYVSAAIALFKTAYLFPLGILLPLVTLVAFFSLRRERRVLAAFAVLFFAIWVITEPVLYPRFILIILPAVAVLAGVLVDKLVLSARKLLRWPLHVIAGGSTALFVLTAPVLASDAVRFDLSNDAAIYHRFTWFYPTYQWVDRNLPASSRFLVVASSGQTYYLDRFYRRVDPWIGGAIDWPAMTADSLIALMKRNGYGYFVYEDRDWSMFPGGREMRKVVNEAIARGELKPIRKFDERLYFRRVTRDFELTRVYILQLNADSPQSTRG